MTATNADFDPVDHTLRIASEGFYVVIDASADALTGLDAVARTDWAAGRSLQIGSTGLGRVYWTAGETPDRVVLLIGRDDETWDVSLTVSADVVAQVVAQARAAQQAH